MKEIKPSYPPEIPEKFRNTYDDDNIPEIDLPKRSNAADVVPDEVPRRDGPGGE